MLDEFKKDESLWEQREGVWWANKQAFFQLG
jgi:hypothetical protein